MRTDVPNGSKKVRPLYCVCYVARMEAHLFVQQHSNTMMHSNVLTSAGDKGTKSSCIQIHTYRPCHSEYFHC